MQSRPLPPISILFVCLPLCVSFIYSIYLVHEVLHVVDAERLPAIMVDMCGVKY